MKTDLSIQKMADKAAPIVMFKDTADKVLRDMQSVGILIDKPQDLRNPKNLEEMKLVIREFESAMNSYGEESTMCWLNSYLEWIAFFRENGMEEDEGELLESEFFGDSRDAGDSGASGASTTPSGTHNQQEKDSEASGSSGASTTPSGDQNQQDMDSGASEASTTPSGASGAPVTSSGASAASTTPSGALKHQDKNSGLSGASEASKALVTSSGASGASLTSPETHLTRRRRDSEASRDPRALSGPLQDSESSKNPPMKSQSAFHFSYTDIPAFLQSEPQYQPMLRLNTSLCLQNQPGCLQKFLFTTGFTSVVKYQEMYPMVLDWRRIAKEHEKMGVYAYTERSNFVDQTADMVENIWITVVSEVVCMAISFVFFIPDTVSIISAVFSLLSVNFGVFGFLSIWKVGMDPVSLASLLMSIGFSVDISAHISYHYYQVDNAVS